MNAISSQILSVWHKKVLNLISDIIADSNEEIIRIADIACDEGMTLIEISKIFGKKVELYGIDYRSDPIEKATRLIKDQNLENINFEFDYFLKKDFSCHKPYDIVIFSEVYEHLIAENQMLSLRIIGNLLRDNGILIMTTPNGDHLLSNERKKTFNDKYHPAFFENIQQTFHWLEPNKKELLKILISLGFDILECRYFKLPFSGRFNFLWTSGNIIARFGFLNPFLKTIWGHIYVVARKNPKSPLLTQMSLY